MTSAVLAGINVEVDAEGYLTDNNQWNMEIGEAISESLGIQLSPDHWKLINFAREDFAVKKQSPGLRRISKATGMGMKIIYKLFPKGPGKLIAKIAGVPKPKSCL